MSKETTRFEVQFWAAEVFQARRLHFSVRDKAHDLKIAGEIRWSLVCNHEAVLEGKRDNLDQFLDFLKSTIRRNAFDMDEFRFEEKEPSGEFDNFTTVFEATEEEAPVVVPDYVSELNKHLSEVSQD